jgi:NADH:ubiquinone oxidoreductase subunit 4 (subunit M)
MGEMNPELVGLKLDLNAREVAILTPLVVLAVYLGLYPEAILSYLRVPVTHLLTLGPTP